MTEYRGLTIRLGADTRPLTSALNSIKSSAGQAQRQLSLVQKSLKFDSTNINLLKSRVELTGDKALHTATSMRAIRTALEQADPAAKRLASSTENIYSKTLSLRTAYNHVNAELQHIYDAARRVYANQNNLDMKSDEVAEHFKEMKLALSGTGVAAENARAELKGLLEEAIAKGSGVASKFGLMKKDLEGLMVVFDNLRVDAKGLNAELKEFGAAQSVQENKVKLEAFEVELKEAAMQAARFRSELHAVSGADGLKAATDEIKRLDASMDKVRASARAMTEAYDKIPGDVAAATAKVRAMGVEEGRLNQKLDATNAKIKALTDSKAFDVEKAAIIDVWQETEKAVAKHARYDEELKKSQADATELGTKLQQALRVHGRGSEEVKKLGFALREAETNVRFFKRQLKAADNDLKKARLAQEFREATEEVIRLKSEIKALGAASSSLNRLKETFRTFRTMGYGLYSTITPALLMAGRYAIQAADDIDAAYRNMRKTVNGTEEEFEHLRDAALDFSTTHFTSADTILEIEAMGGQLGIAASNLEAFGETVSNLDIATNMDSDQIAEQLGKMASVMGMTVDEYDNFGDSLVRLGNNMPVLEGDVMTLTTRFMGMGKVVGMQPDEMLAWAAAASATGQKAEAAGSSMQRFIAKMESAVVGGGDVLEQWAGVAHMTGDEFKAAFNEDASAAMYKFIEGLGDIQKEGGSVNQTLQDLKINNVRDKQLLEGLANQMANGTHEANLLAEALRMSSDAYHGMSTVMDDGTIERAGDAAREAGRKAEGFSGALQIMKNNANVLLNELAEGAAPIIRWLGEAFKGLTDMVRQMPDEMKTGLTIIAGLFASFGPAAIAIGAVGTAITSIIEMYKASLGAKVFADVAGHLSKWRLGFEKLATAIGPAEIAIAKGTVLAGDGASKMQLLTAAVGSATTGYLALGAAVAALAAFTIVGWAHIFEKEAEKAEKYNETISKSVEYTRNLKDSNEVLAQSFSALSEGQKSLSEEAREANEAWDAYLDAGSDLYKRYKENEKAAYESSASVKYYSDKILELAGKCASASDIEELSFYIEKFNEMTGAGLEIVDKYSGAVNLEKDAIEANTEAVIRNAYVKAYQDDLQGAIEKRIDAMKAYEEATDAYVKAQQIVREGEAKGYDKMSPVGNEDVQKYLTAKTALGGLKDQVNETRDGLVSCEEEISNLEESLAEMTKGAGDSEASVRAFANSLQDYMDALGEEHMEEFAKAMDGITDSSEEFAKMLSYAGVSAEDFAKIGSEGFHNLYKAADGDIQRIGIALAMLDAMHIDPVKMHVEDDGSIKDTEGRIWDLDAATGTLTEGDHVYKLTADGIVEVTEQAEDAENQLTDATDETYEVDMDSSKVVAANDRLGEMYKLSTTINGYNATANVNVRDNASWKLDEIKRTLWNLSGRTITVGVDAIFSKLGFSATGGFLDMHASGGFITNGVTDLGTDRYGVRHIAGEAGREWVMRHADGTTSIVPIQNRRYLKPYANTIASMIGTTTNNSPTYNITVNASGDGDDIARQVTRAIRAQELMRGRR